MSDFREALAALLNRHSKENESDTPDYILAKLLDTVLAAFAVAVNRRDAWHGGTTDPSPDPSEAMMAARSLAVGDTARFELSPRYDNLQLEALEAERREEGYFVSLFVRGAPYAVDAFLFPCAPNAAPEGAPDS